MRKLADLIVTYTPTIMAGPVIRWHTSEYGAKHVKPIVSASRNGVRVEAYLSDIPDGLLDLARGTWHALRHGEDMQHLATHDLNLRGDKLEPLASAPRACRTCDVPAVWVESPTGGWWSHLVHPADHHEADIEAKEQ